MENKTTSLQLSHKQRKRSARLQTILEAARQIMRSEGVAALTMQELARRLDMRAPSLYNYFTSKMDLYDTLFRLGIHLYGEYWHKIKPGQMTLSQEIQASMEAYFTFAMENPELYQLCFERPVPGFVPSEESLQASFGLLQELYNRTAAWKLSLKTDLSAQQMADTMIAMIHGITALHLANEPDLPLGQGRFGSLIPVMVSILEQSWIKI